MKNKKYLFLIILLFPAALKLILEFTTINSRKLPFYGEKTPIGQDTVYQKVNDVFYTHSDSVIKTTAFDSINFPLFTVCFIKKDYAKIISEWLGLANTFSLIKVK